MEKSPSKKDFLYKVPELFSDLTITEAAAKLNCATSTIRNALLESGHAIYLKNGRIAYSAYHLEMLGVPSLRELEFQERAEVQERLDRILRAPALAGTYAAGLMAYINSIREKGRIGSERLA